MKLNKLNLYLLLFLVMIGCTKYIPPVLAPYDFSKTQYDFLGTWNSNGVPNYLVSPSDSITQGMSNFINSTFPEGKNNLIAHPELFNGVSSSIQNVTSKSTLYVTYAHDGAGSLNSVGFYTYPTNNPPTTASEIAKITILFPSAKAAGNGGYLPLGSKVNIGTFEAGTSIGFVIVQAGWTSYNSTFYAGGQHFAGTDAVNPETDPGLQKHAIKLTYQGTNLICFEDSNRQTQNADDDFNDVILYVKQVPSN